MDGNINTLFTNLATTIRNVSVAVGVFAFMWGRFSTPLLAAARTSWSKASLP